MSGSVTHRVTVWLSFTITFRLLASIPLEDTHVDDLNRDVIQR